jgi:hypothetical protein
MEETVSQRVASQDYVGAPTEIVGVDAKRGIILRAQDRHGETRQYGSRLIALTRASQRPMMPAGISRRPSTQYPDPGAGPLAHARRKSV